MRLIEEEGYAQTMAAQVNPYMDERMEAGTFERRKGETIYYESYQADKPQAVLVLVHGFTEGIRKFRETAYYFVQAGFNVWSLQQRGHGKSYRGVEDRYLVDIADYHDLVEDLHFFVHQRVKKAPANQGLPLYYYGHSMGGGVGACYLETYPGDFSRAVLSSPMLEMDSGAIPVWAAAIYAHIMLAFRKGQSYMPGSVPFSGKADFEGSYDNSKARYDYWFAQQLAHGENQTSVPSIRSALQFLKLTQFATNAKNCSRVKAKVLLFQAGRDNVVKPGGQNRFMENIGKKGKLVRIPQSRHEIYMGTQDILSLYWTQMLNFLK